MGGSSLLNLIENYSTLALKCKKIISLDVVITCPFAQKSAAYIDIQTRDEKP